MLANVCRLLLVLWAGSMWSLAMWVAPTLFYAQSDRHLAGVLAARLFSVETYLGLGVALLAVTLPGRTRFAWGYAAVVLLVANEWALKRVMALAQTHGAVGGLTFGAWHGVAALVYLLACLAVLRLIWHEDFR